MGIRGNRTKGSSRETIQAGQVLSNEPGYYPKGKYGIRIENLVLVKPAPQAGWLEFEDLTVFPLEKKLVDFDRLTTAQRKWLVDYHEQVLAALRPLLSDQAEIAWLEDACGDWG
jgi:Xaa-Pro aminopeptidase